MPVKKVKFYNPKGAKALLERHNALPISIKEWEDMINSALRNCDHVLKDDRIRGDLRSYARCIWRYWPLKFEASWEVVGGCLILLTFDVINEYTGLTAAIRDTAEFRGFLIYADETRKRLAG